MKPELILGTAQFGFDYGITNLEGKIKFNEVISILKKAQEYKIIKLDTAQGYGDAEKIIGQAKSKNSNFKISSKLIPFERNINLSEPQNLWLKSLKNSFNNLKVLKLDSLIVHRANDFFGDNKNLFLKWLLQIKEEGLVNKIGVSIYHDDNVMDLPLKYIDLIQLPLSTFDQRSIKSGLISFLKSKDIEIQARSIFLQGLILAKPPLLPDWVSLKDREFHKKYWEILLKKNLSSLEVSLNFFKHRKDVDSVVFGVENVSQLNEIHKIWSKKSSNNLEMEPLQFSSQFLDPRKWPNLKIKS